MDQRQPSSGSGLRLAACRQRPETKPTEHIRSARTRLRTKLNAPSHPEAQSRPRPEPSQPVCRTDPGPGQESPRQESPRQEADHENFGRLFHKVVLNAEPMESRRPGR